MKSAPPQRMAFKRVGGVSFATTAGATGLEPSRMRHQKVRKGFSYWFGVDDTCGVMYATTADVTSSQTSKSRKSRCKPSQSICCNKLNRSGHSFTR